MRVKYALIILEGAVDESVAELGGATPLEAASAPNIDVIAQAGRVGLCAASPTGMRPTSLTATMSLLGCDPGEIDPAMGPLSALARGVETEAGDRVWRLTFISAPGGVVMSPSVDSIDAPEARALVSTVVEAWRVRAPDLAERFRATAIDSTGCVLIERRNGQSGAAEPALPIDLIGQTWRSWAPNDRGLSSIARLIEIGSEALSGCEVNRARRSAGAATVDVAWIWGGGLALKGGRSFAERFALRGAVAGQSEHAVGVGRLIGLERAPMSSSAVSGGDDLASLGETVAGAMDRYDLVVAHVRTPAEASIRGDVEAKTRAIEAIDSLVVGPALRRFDRLDRLGTKSSEGSDDGFRIMVAATAEVSCIDRAAMDFPTLVTMGGTWMEGQVSRRLTERDAAESDLRVEPGHEILEFFLLSGLQVQMRRPTRVKQQEGGPSSE